MFSRDHPPSLGNLSRITYSAGIFRGRWGGALNCSLASAQDIVNCVVIAKDWIATIKPFLDLGLGLLGVGTIGLVGLLTWVTKKLRQDIEQQQKSVEELRETAKHSIEAATEAKSQVQGAEWRLDQLLRERGPVDGRLQIANDTISKVRTASQGDAAEFWSRPVGRRLEDYERLLRDSIPVCLFANQKGGVGKTTLCANLAACFAERGERVLTIDLDYQGSMTGLMIAQSGQRPSEFPSMVDLLHGETLNDLWPGTAIVSAHKNLDFISCWLPFEKLERNLEYLWVLDEGLADIRFRLARAVLSRPVQSNYDRVMIDAPPRMTTGFMNGFCASTHLFVPTVVDNVSATAVGTFARRFRRLQHVNPVLSFAGIIGTMTTVARLTQSAQIIANTAESSVRAVLNSNSDYFIRNAVMMRTPNVSNSAESGIAYLQSPATQPMFKALADEIARRAPRRTP